MKAKVSAVGPAKGFVDAGRALIAVGGGDRVAFLQGLVTNDVARVAPARAVYAALLTPQGKYLFDFFLLDGGDGAVLIDVARNQAQALGLRLKMYCLRRDAEISVRNDLQVALVWGAGPDAPGLGGAMVVADPRAAQLGWRAYASDAGAALAGVTTGTQAEYDALRIAALVPETGVELQSEQTFILEAGFERLDGVDFRKGCYVGQEVTARMKHKTELRKGLVAVRLEGAAEPGTPVTRDGKAVGTLFTSDGARALAHLRLDRAGPGMEAGAARVHYPAD